MTCDDSGQCVCKPNVVGKRCERCDELLYNLAAGCQPCEQCYKVIQKRTTKYRNSINDVQQSLLTLTELLQSTGPAELQEFSQKLAQTQERLNNMVWYVGNITKNAPSTPDKPLERVVLDVLTELDDLQTAGNALGTVITKTIVDHGLAILSSNVSAIADLMLAQVTELSDRFLPALEDIRYKLQYDFVGNAQTADESVDMPALLASFQVLQDHLNQ